jgi:excisionase family DNA binding protein
MVMLQAESLLLTNEAARILEVSPQTVRLWERSGRLPAIRTSSGTRLFDSAKVERLREERQRQRRVSTQPAEATS